MRWNGVQCTYTFLYYIRSEVIAFFLNIVFHENFKLKSTEIIWYVLIIYEYLGPLYVKIVSTAALYMHALHVYVLIHIVACHLNGINLHTCFSLLERYMHLNVHEECMHVSFVVK